MTKITKSYTFLIVLIFLLLTSCQSLVPATTPPQLEHTPGTPLTVTDNQIEAEWVTLTYPDGWRIVTNIAIEPLRILFISPDDEMIITIQDTSNIDFSLSTPQASDHQRMTTLSHDDGHRLTIFGEIDNSRAESFDSFFDEVVASVQFQ